MYEFSHSQGQFPKVSIGGTRTVRLRLALEHGVADLLLEHGAELVAVIEVEHVHRIGQRQRRVARRTSMFSSFAYEALNPRL